MMVLWIGFAFLLLETVLAKQTLNVLVISDFSLAFVPSHSTIDRSAFASGPFICPPSAYPNALAQFQFTSDVIAGVNKNIPMSIQYYAYSGGDGEPLGKIFSSRDNFTEASIPAYTKFCAEGPEENDFERFIKLTITPSINTDLLILFTAATQAQVNNALPIISNNVKRVIVLGLNGTSGSGAYPKSAVTLSDFSQPDLVSCMVNELYETIYGKLFDVDAVSVCYPHEKTTVVTTVEPTTTPLKPMRILFVNDFTSDYMQEDNQRSSKFREPSNSIKCPGGIGTPEAANEFDFTDAIVQGISDDLLPEIFYYAYIGESHAIPTESDDKNGFSSGNAKREYMNYVCYDDPEPSDLPSLTNTIRDFETAVSDIDIIVLLLASSQSAFDSAFPFPTDATVITVGLKGASAFNAYPDTATVVNDFSHPEVINCMIEAAYRGEKNTQELCGAPNQRPPMTILFVNDFTSGYMKVDDSRYGEFAKTSNAIKCPFGMYPEAASEVDFTNAIVQEVSDDAQMVLYYYANIGDMHHIPPPMDKNGFAGNAGAEFKDYVCSEDVDDFLPSDLQRLAGSCLNQITANVLVLFTTENLSQPLPYVASNYDRIITVGLNGADQSKAYPNSSISISDFSRPQVLSCMIDRLWGNLWDNSLLSCAN